MPLVATLHDDLLMFCRDVVNEDYVLPLPTLFGVSYGCCNWLLGALLLLARQRSDATRIMQAQSTAGDSAASLSRFDYLSFVLYVCKSRQAKLDVSVIRRCLILYSRDDCLHHLGICMHATMTQLACTSKW